MGFIVLVAVIAVPLLLLQILAPRGVWRATEAWKFRNPDANEPSDAAYAMSRIGAVFGLIGLIVAGVIFYDLDQDVKEREREAQAEAERTLEIPNPTYESPTPQTTDLGPGTVLGYRYPSELTLEIVMLEGPRQGFDSCTTGVSVHEHTNAIVVESSRTFTDYDFDGTAPDAAAVCSDEKPATATRKLDHPVGGRPILTAAPFGDPAKYGLVLGPRSGATPLAEVPEPGVVEPQHPVRVDPAWKRVPLLAPESDQ